MKRKWMGIAALTLMLTACNEETASNDSTEKKVMLSQQRAKLPMQ